MKKLIERPELGLAAAIKLYTPVMKAVSIRVLGTRVMDTEECIADSFTALWKNAENLMKKGTPVKAWLIVTVRNNSINRIKRINRDEYIPLVEEITEDCAVYNHKDEMLDLTEQLVFLISDMDREIFVRKYYLLETVSEIALTLNISEDNVSQRLSRGRKRIKENLEERGAQCYE